MRGFGTLLCKIVRAICQDLAGSNSANWISFDSNARLAEALRCKIVHTIRKDLAGNCPCDANWVSLVLILAWIVLQESISAWFVWYHYLDFLCWYCLTHGRPQKFSQGGSKSTLSFSGCGRCNANGRTQNALPFYTTNKIPNVTSVVANSLSSKKFYTEQMFVSVSMVSLFLWLS